MGRKGEREGEKHQCVLASHMPPSGDLANKPGMCPDWESNQQPLVHRPAPNPWSHTSQGSNTHLKKKKKTVDLEIVILRCGPTHSTPTKLC